jgi:TIR domain
MAKPTAFLSHSSKNHRELTRLKQLLDQKAVGSIDFFLSSDDESIRFGKLWPEEVHNALKRAKLMFVFVSVESLESGWTYFEAGYGYRQLACVTPMCLPGIDRGSIPAPLGLLQAHNLHTAKDLNVLIKLCNKAFDTKIAESFTRTEFEQIFRLSRLAVDSSPLWTNYVERLVVTIDAKEGSAEQFATICDQAGLDCDRTNLNTDRSPTLIASGITLRLERRYDFEFAQYLANGKPVMEKTKRQRKLAIIPHQFEMSAEMIDETFPVLDQWRKVTKAGTLVKIELEFTRDVVKEHKPHELTRRIFRSPVSLLPDGSYRFGNLDFYLDDRIRLGGKLALQLHWPEALTSLQIGELVSCLVSLGVLIDLSRPAKKRSR